MRCALLGFALGWTAVSRAQDSAASAAANPGLQHTLQAMTEEPAVARAHWGISVVRMSGTVAAQVNAGQFFQPASNAKLFTTAAAMALLPMDERLKTRVLTHGTVEAGGVIRGDLVLTGVGDANFSGRPVPYRVTPAGQPEAPRDELRYVRELADQVKAAGVTRVEGSVIGDDSLFPWDPYPQDWAWDDLPWYYGAPVNALMVGDNAVTLTVMRAGSGDGIVVATLSPDFGYYTIDLQVKSTARGTGTAVDVGRSAESKTITVRGTLAADAKPYVQGLSIADPAEYAAMALKAALEADGIAVTGSAAPRHTPLVEPDFAKTAGDPLRELLPPAKPLFEGQPQCLNSTGTTQGQACWLAEHVGPPLYDDIVVTNKTSQNQHAEAFLRQLGLAETGTGTTAEGARVVRAFLTRQAGVDGGDFVLVDGSGLSGHDLVTPRAATTLLRYAAAQPWGERWKASLPIGGVDGSLRARFTGELKGRVFAKTGTLGEARALSGYVIGASGKTVVFSVMVTGHTPLNNEDAKVMDRMVAAIAAAE